jgi:hypothetical protein
MEKMIRPIKTIGPLFAESQFKDVKDPCVVFDGKRWHIYGSGGDVRRETWQILHAIAPDIEGPWQEMTPVIMQGLRGDHVAAPSVWFESAEHTFHMTVQTEFTSIGGNVEYLISHDGQTFTHAGTALHSVPDSSEAGIYDPHQAVIDNKKYIVYAGTPAIEGFNNSYVIQPDIHLAVSAGGWQGPWQRLGKILDHDHIDWHHNGRHHKEYEWGIEGPQLVPLPNGKILLNATCFLCEGAFGTRQRVFFALGDTVTGPYNSVGPVLPPDQEVDSWQSGENGHATALVHNDYLYLFYQARSRHLSPTADNNWRYGIALYHLEDLK